MFQSKEEMLKESEHKSGCDCLICGVDVHDGMKLGIEKAFKSIAKRIDFYKRYRTRLWDERIKKYWTGVQEPWEDWLFHFCFDEVK